jgi:hypothetical protein
MANMDRPPAGFDEDEADWWCEWVLDHDLPEPPGVLAKGQAVPIARWAGPQFGAVLSAAWSWSTDHETFGSDELISIVQVFRRTATGWEGTDGDGGSSWFDPPFQPPKIDPREVEIFGLHYSGRDGWHCAARYGMVGSGIAFADLVTDDFTVRRPIESRVGAVIVAFDPSFASVIGYVTHEGVVEEEVSFDPKRDFA